MGLWDLRPRVQFSSFTRSHRLVVRTFGFQLKNRGSILLGSTVEGLFYIFALGVIISEIMVISALNPIHSVFWLIVVFLGASALFILLGIDFIALIFLIVYVGAIAILFLFVIMMLNLTDLEGGGDMSNYIPIGSGIGVLLLFEVLIMGREATAYNYRDIDHECLKGGVDA